MSKRWLNNGQLARVCSHDAALPHETAVRVVGAVRGKDVYRVKTASGVSAELPADDLVWVDHVPVEEAVPL